VTAPPRRACATIGLGPDCAHQGHLADRSGRRLTQLVAGELLDLMARRRRCFHVSIMGGAQSG